MKKDPGLSARAQTLLKEISKKRDEQWNLISEMQSKGMDITDKYIDDYEASLNIYNCYEKLLSKNIETESDYKELKWLFNNGDLRSNTELNSHIEFLKRERFQNSLEFEKRDMGIMFSKNESSRVNKYLFWIITPVVPFLLAFCTSTESAVFFGIIFDVCVIFSIPITYIIIGAINLGTLVDMHKERKNLYAKTNKECPFPTDLAISAASYGLFLAMTASNIKKRFKK